MASLQLGPPTKQNSTSLESTFRTFSNRFLKKTSIQFLDNICSKDSRGASRSDQITYRNLSLHTPVRFIPETGYEDILPEDYYPRKVQGMGVPMGLTLVLNASLNEYYCSSSRSFGFKIRLHIPSDTPRVADYAKLIPTKYETRVLITPSYRDTAQAVRSLPVTARNCLYNSESDLEYFQIYSSNNCELECTSKIMEEECGCVQTYLPRSSNKTITCGLKDFICSQRVEKELSGLVNPRRKCKDCLWSCSFIDFDETISRSRLMENAPMLNEVLPGGYNVSELAVVHFYYNRKTMRVTRMEAYLGFLDFFCKYGWKIFGY
ncbi:pickpocket protein 28-like [Hermetia illucens]|uniref:pickpocket protein 28-like n=1 Tax=Hermetia illucens TaxID=343691 RepID=UPI0018CC6929|nr:pickpocket protein 28-like [Hermetia illucens]